MTRTAIEASKKSTAPTSRRSANTCTMVAAWPKNESSAQAAALVVGAEEVLAAGACHRGRRADLETERGAGDDLREAIDLAGAGAVDRREPVACGGKRRSPSDGADLETREADRRVQAPFDASRGAVGHRRGADHAEILSGRGEDGRDRRRRCEGDRLHAGGDGPVRSGPGE